MELTFLVGLYLLSHTHPGPVRLRGKKDKLWHRTIHCHSKLWKWQGMGQTSRILWSITLPWGSYLILGLRYSGMTPHVLWRSIKISNLVKCWHVVVVWILVWSRNMTLFSNCYLLTPRVILRLKLTLRLWTWTCTLTPLGSTLRLRFCWIVSFLVLLVSDRKASAKELKLNQGQQESPKLRCFDQKWGGLIRHGTIMGKMSRGRPKFEKLAGKSL